ncbi:MAG: hypothetical protein Q8862_11075, partial [Bacteroidota bacterium]|nr:hypothetical protein [Bacteroidota bacterium]
MKKTVCLKTSKFTTTIPVIHILFVFILLGGWINSFAQELPRWKIDNSGAIVWKTDNRLPHSDHIEMSGLKLSAVIHYGVNSEGGYTIQRTIVWPMLRIIPNDTYGSFIRNFNWDIFNSINVNGSPIQNEKVTEISHNGLMVVKSMVGGELECTRVLFPSTTKPVFNEQYQILNKSSNVITVEIPDYKNTFYTDPDKGVAGSYAVTACSVGGGVYKLKPNEAVTFGAQFYAYKKSENIDLGQIADEKIERENLVKLWWKNLVLETPDPILNKAFAFAKIRAAESIYQTKGGLMHSPGGETYYAAIWANDQAEYIGPFFPYLGYETGNKASLNAYLHYARFMNPEYKPIPSSIIAEGTDIWNGAGDRGDAAMIAYGASRYALVKGNLDEAKQLWPLIEWCLEYCKRKLNDKGVVTSNCDELEGRFPAGNANLCTSSLYYDALHSAAMLGKDLEKPAAQLLSYEKEAAALKIAIENYFGCKVEGFDTYRYYKENNVLRAWIC